MSKQHLLSTDNSLLKRWSKFLTPVSNQINFVTEQGLRFEKSLDGLLWIDIASVKIISWMSLFWSDLLENEKLSILIASSAPTDKEGLTALRVGCSGYFHAYCPEMTLQQICLSVENGNVWVGKDLMKRLIESTAMATKSQDIWRTRLTAREIEIAELVANGASNKEVMSAFNVSESTVKSHLAKTFQALGVSDRMQLAFVVHGKKLALKQPDFLQY